MKLISSEYRLLLLKRSLAIAVATCLIMPSNGQIFEVSDFHSCKTKCIEESHLYFSNSKRTRGMCCPISEISKSVTFADTFCD